MPDSDERNALVKQQELSSDSIQRAISTMYYVLNNPYKAVFCYYTNIVSKQHDASILAFCINLYRLGIADELSYSNKGEDYGILQQLIDLNKNERLSRDEKAKRFMEYVLDVCFYNKLDKIRQIKQLESGEIEEVELEQKHHRTRLIKKSLNQWARANNIPVKINYDKNRASLDSHNKTSTYYVKTIAANDTDVQASARRRTVKKKLLKPANAIALVVGLGEGLVAMALGGLPLITGLFVIGLPAWIVNYYLFKGTAFSTLKQIAFGGLYKTEDGVPIPDNQRWKITATLVSSFAAAACFGFLSFGSGLQAFGSLFFGLTATAAVGIPPVGLVLLAAVVATVTTVALTTLFYCSIADFIKNNRGQAIKARLKKIYVDDLFKNKSKQPLLQRITKAVLHTLFLSLIVSGAVLVTLSTFGLFMDKTTLILASTFKASEKLAHSMALTANLIALPVNVYFYTYSVKIAVNVAQRLLSKVLNPRNTWSSAVNFFSQRKKSPVNWAINVFNKIKECVLNLCLIGNTYGQGNGGKEPGAIHMMQTIIPASSQTVGDFGFAANAAASLGPNSDAVQRALQEPDKVTAKTDSRTPYCFYINQSTIDDVVSRDSVSKPIPIPGCSRSQQSPEHSYGDKLMRPPKLSGQLVSSVRSEEVRTPLKEPSTNEGVFLRYSP